MADINYNMDDYSLKQGSKFNAYHHDYANIVGKRRLDLIEETTSEHLQSLHENMENIQNPISKKSDAELSKLKTLESEFNNTLQQYKNTYKSYLENVVQNNDVVNTYKNQNVMDEGGSFYYVNDYGFTRGYSTPAWNQKPSSCLQTVPTDESTSIYKRMQHGVNYTPGQPCDLDGKVIRNSQTGHLSWVAPNGVKHYYPSDEIRQASIQNGCPSQEVSVSNEVYNMFESGANMTNTTKCFENNQQASMMNQIVQLNSRLMSIAQEMYNVMEQMDKDEDIIDGKLNAEKAQLQMEITNLDNERSKLQNLQNSINRLDGELEQTSIMTNMEYLQYIGWTVGAIGLAILAGKHIVS
jgi:hypothetical protein